MACQARARASRSRGRRGRVVGRGDQLGRLERRLGATTQPPALVGDGVAGDLEEPDAEGRTLVVASLVEARQRRQRAQEDDLGQVLRTMVVAQLVDGEAVHLAHVLPIERFERPRVPTSRLHGRSIRVERDRAP